MFLEEFKYVIKEKKILEYITDVYMIYKQASKKSHETYQNLSEDYGRKLYRNFSKEEINKKALVQLRTIQ